MNWVGKRTKLINLDPDRLIAAAERQTGLSDWGAPQFLNDYRFLMEIVARKPDLTTIGRFAARTETMHMLTNRLRMQEIFKRRPEILQLPIEAPYFIIGLPRTGTTLLHALLASSTEHRSPYFWQLYSPFPLDEPPETAARIKRAETIAGQYERLIPPMGFIHPLLAHEPEECVFLLPHHMVIHGQYDERAYPDWYLARSATPDYAYHKQQLQSLDAGQPQRRWVLKSPFHLFHLDALLAIYPDARIVQTHRDIKQVIGSWCSFEAFIGLLFREKIDLKAIGREWMMMWAKGLRRAITVRERVGSDRFFDVSFASFTADPVGAIRQIYDHFGDAFTPETERAVNEQHQRVSAGSRTPHRYDIAQFGLTNAQIDAEFAFYRDYFQRYME